MAREQRAEHEDGRAHGLDEIVGRDGFAELAGVHPDFAALAGRHGDAHAPEQPDHGRDIVQLRDIPDRDRRVGQESRGEDRQRRVLGAGGAHLALEAPAAGDLKLVQDLLLCAQPAARRAHSSGVGVSSCNAWISPPTAPPSAP